MEDFTNKTLNISALPKFEETQLQPLEKKYFFVMLLQRSLFYIVLLGVFLVVYFMNAKASFLEVKLVYLLGVWSFLVWFGILYLRISFTKKGFALREHDVIFKSGVVSETTIIVTNNRVQHVALHQGLLSRYFGLASIELFTAGGSSSDLKINGLLLEDAKKIKESVSEKIIEITEEFKEETTTNDSLINEELKLEVDNETK
ncbi:PH domain-containing protein [Flavobacterium sp. NRK F7]|uniref:PH domain-containing protein n=1 Tax=Flavobacterium sp. NRK F7 TaxID=2954930 RepID=UPI0020917CF9|nr:PH domain-containing protein [Flavobacterium sp. NRK F7]MCO6162981.1 PH domain-containing protein [Flavobacterium sp. NRK F7]